MSPERPATNCESIFVKCSSCPGESCTSILKLGNFFETTSCVYLLTNSAYRPAAEKWITMSTGPALVAGFAAAGAAAASAGLVGAAAGAAAAGLSAGLSAGF